MTKIPEWWIETILGEIVEVKSWSTPSTKEESYWDWDISWITPKDLSSYNKRFIDRWEKNITGLWLKKSSAQLLPKNTVLFSSRAPIWYVAIANKELTTNQWFKNLVCDEINSHFMFFYYRLKNKKDFIEWLASWSTFSEISWTWMKNLPVILPPLPEQKAIAGVLSAFDDKIELLRAENQTLEEMGQTLFKERFGKYKAWDELPDGWKVGKLGDIVDNYDSKRIPIASDKREIWEYPYYWATGINWYVKDYIFDWIYTLLWEDWSVMKENWKPFTQYVWWKIRVNNHAHVLQWKNWFSTEIIKIILDSVDITPYVTWAVQLKISQWNMNSIPVIIPTDDVLVKFNSLINPIFAKIRANSEEIESLSKTRDQLLPKLMSWEVRVEF